ncbi:MAG: hypothetical protein M1812_005983 [Candelaria pacifica]|nr:MAG: hypothetical protein M1812_005983 [Candelaria pacifica]
MSTGTKLSLTGPPKEFVPEREGITVFARSNPGWRKWFGLRYVSDWDDLKNLVCSTFGIAGEMVVYQNDDILQPLVWPHVVRAGGVYGVSFYPYLTGIIVLKNRPAAAGPQPGRILGHAGTSVVDAGIQQNAASLDITVRTSTNVDVAEFRRQVWYSLPSNPTSGHESLLLASVSPWRLNGEPTAGVEVIMENGREVGEYLWGQIDYLVVEVTELNPL